MQSKKLLLAIAIIVMFVCVTAFQFNPKVHTRWEYKTVEGNLSPAGDTSELNELGYVGWELISVQPGGGMVPGTVRYIFKREKIVN